jgi:F-type H+-transporting ATPase subunit a
MENITKRPVFIIIKFENLVPQGQPIILISFIIIIDTISNIIRPGTLAMRLTANINAGHLLLNLLGDNGPSIKHTLLPVLITAQILLLILEAAVAIIQSYVFAILRILLE